jgi:hypothetical protein
MTKVPESVEKHCDTVPLKGLCNKINNFFEGLKNQISTFCICADSF